MKDTNKPLYPTCANAFCNWLIVLLGSTVVISNRKGSLEKGNPKVHGSSNTQIEWLLVTDHCQAAFKISILPKIAHHDEDDARVLCSSQMEFEILYLKWIIVIQGEHNPSKYFASYLI